MTDCKLETSDFIVSSDLWPGDAQTVRTELLEWLKEQPAGTKVDLDSDVATPSPSALQILIAATRRTNGPAPALGKKAAAAVAEYTKPQIMKRDTE